MAIGATLAVYAVERFISSSVKGAVALRNFRTQSGQSIKELQKWQVSGVLSDTTLSFEQIAAAIQSAQKNLTLMRFGGGDKSAYNLLGIGQEDTIFKVLERLRQKIKGLDDAAATTLIEKFGLPPNFINILRQSSDEFEQLGKLSKEFLTEKDRSVLIEMGTAMTDLGIRVKIIKDRFAVMLSVQILPLMKGFKWIADQVGFAANFVDAIADRLPDMLGWVVKLHDFLKDDTILTDILNDMYKLGEIIKTNIIDPLDSFFDRVDDKMGAFKKISSFAAGGGIGIGGGIAGGLKNTFNNTFHINSTADANTVANRVVSKEQEQLNKALESINNGTIA